MTETAIRKISGLTPDFAIAIPCGIDTSGRHIHYRCLTTALMRAWHRRGHYSATPPSSRADAYVLMRAFVSPATPPNTPPTQARCAGRRGPHHPRPDVQDALRTDGAVARAAGDHHQEQLHAANRPNRPGPAAGPLVLGESAAHSRTQSGSRRAPAGAEAGRTTQQQDAKITSGSPTHRAASDCRPPRSAFHPMGPVLAPL